MNLKDNTEHKSPDKVRQIETFLVPTEKHIYPHFIFKTPKKLPSEEIKKKSPITVNC